MQNGEVMVFRRIIVLWASLLLSGASFAIGFTTIPLPSLNTNIGTWTGGSAYGTVFANSISTWNGVPFLLAKKATGENAYIGTLDIPVNLQGASNVYAVMNSSYGTVNSVVGSIEFNGSAGAYQKVDIVEGKHIRDHYPGSYNNVIDNINGVPAFVGTTGARLDMQIFHLAPEFENQTLVSVRFASKGGNPQGIPFLAALTVSSASSVTVVSGDILEDTTWQASESPYLVASDVVVRNNAKLTIEAGTTVYMGAGTSLTVQSGALSAIGTVQQPIRVTSQKIQSGQSPAPGDWNQWIFGSGTVGTRVENTTFEYGKGVVVAGASPIFNDLVLKNNQGAAITTDLSASPTGSGNRASGNTFNAIVVPAGDITGDVTWSLKGLPYLIQTGTVSIGSSPKIETISPHGLQQGESTTFSLTGSRLSGLSSAIFDTTGLTATVLAGGSATSASLVVTASPETNIGSASLRALTDAGEIGLADALTVIQKQPKLSTIIPSKVYLGQGEVEVTLTGTNLSNQSTVLLNEAAITSSHVSALSMRATLPNQSTLGKIPIRLSTPDSIHGGQTLTSNEISISVERPELVLSPAAVASAAGGSQNLTLTLPYPAPAGGMTINVASTVPTVAAIPATVFVPQGETTATMQVIAASSGATTITASYSDWTSARASISVFSASMPPLLAEYRLDETSWSGSANEVKDSTVNVNHGVAVNGATTSPAKLCRGAYFDGTTNRSVTLPAKIQDLVQNTFTMMLWVKPGRTHEIDVESSSSVAGTAGQNYALYPNLNSAKWNWDASGYAGAGVSVGTNGISVYEHAGNYMPPVLVWAGAVSSSDWTHVAVVYNSGIPSLYVNGVFKKTGLNGARTNVVPTFVIGSSGYGNYSYGVDEYKLFGSVITAQDIAAIFTNEAAGRNWDGSTRVCGGE